MGKKRFTEEQIAYALRQQEAGTPVTELTRKRPSGTRRPARVWKSFGEI